MIRTAVFRRTMGKSGRNLRHRGNNLAAVVLFELLTLIVPRPVDARVLSAGPGKQFSNPSEAIAAASDGDTIQIDAGGNYFNDVAIINTSHLTIEGVGSQRAVIKTDGRVYGRKGIWVFAETATDLTLRNIDFEGARVSEKDGANGAGIRALGRNLTVENCRFHNNQDGILGGLGVTTIEHCEFDHNGLTGLTHNLYIGDQNGTLIFRFNYSHDTVIGHLLKSRAAKNIIEYNRLSDDTGTGSYELNLPNGGSANIIGNIIQQSAKSQNHVIFSYGEEGITHPNSELNVVNNTFVNDADSGTFISTGRLPAGCSVRLLNNIFAGPGTVISGTTARQAGNFIGSVTQAGFTDPAKFDFHLSATSGAIGLAIDPGCDSAGAPLIAVNEYVNPRTTALRKIKPPVDAGACSRAITR
jgi:hypothetical protein